MPITDEDYFEKIKENIKLNLIHKNQHVKMHKNSMTK